MRGQDFSIHVVINLTNGLPPHLRRPNQIGRPLGLRDSTPSFVHDHLIPVSPGTITRSSPTWGRAEGTSWSCWYPTSTCGGRLIALVGGSRLSALAGDGRLSTLAEGGRLSTLVRGGSLSASTGGWLGPVLSPPRGFSGWSLSLGRPRWERSTTRVGIRCPRCQPPFEVGDEMKQALLGYSPVIIAP